MEQQIRFCTTSDGIRIAYATVGQGPPVVRVLGWFTHLEYEWENPRWRRAYEGWSAHFSYTRYDARGTGLSDRAVSNYSRDYLASDLKAVVDALGHEKVALHAVSQGGPIAITFAVSHPERVSHLVLYGSFAREPFSSEQSKTMLTLIRQGWGSDLPAHRQFFTSLFMPDGDMEAIQAFNEMQRVSASPESVAAWFEAFRGQLEVTDLLPKVSVPTLVIHRRGDAIVPFELGREVAAGIPGARFLPLEGRNHALLSDIDVPMMLVAWKATEEFLGAGEKAEAGTAQAGLATILFTDMEGSTTLTQRLGDAKAQEVLRTHNAILREALKGHSGSETKHTGDGIMASFASASQALQCAIAMQRAFAQHNESNPDTPIRVRIGLNAGEPVAEDADLFGTAVQLAARICAHAEPGQILVSDVLQQLAAGKGFTFADKGEATLKGYEKPVRLHEVVWEE
jgi:class 3 adenylate cyclase